MVVRTRLGVAITIALLPVVAPVQAASGGTAPRVTVPLPAEVYVAHRAGGLEGRENSLSAIRSVVATGAAQVVELDARMLADGTVVLMHDGRVDRTTNGSGAVTELTRSAWEALRLTVGGWLDPLPGAEPPPLLADVLDELGGRTIFVVEVKDGRALDAVRLLVEARDLTSSVLVSTNDPDLARRIDGLGLGAHLWRTAKQMRRDDFDSFGSFVEVVSVDVAAAADDIGRAVDSRVPQVWAHTLTTRSERDRMRALGVTGFVTDAPRYVRGRVDVYPVSPTQVKVVGALAPTQVSDRVLTRVRVTSQSGPVNPEAVPRVRSDGFTSDMLGASRRGVSSLGVSTADLTIGAHRLSVGVDAGAGAERRWSAGSADTDLQLLGEDLELRHSTTIRGRDLTLGIRLLDSAAPAYTGIGKEGAGTVAGLSRAGLTLTVRRAGAVVHRATLPGSDTDTPADGEGRVRFRWTAPAPGNYRVKVTQAGAVYRKVSTAWTITVS